MSILERTLRDRGLADAYGALVAFSGIVRDEGMEYTEANVNGIPESRTKEAFDRPEHRFLVVANKFQTGFDQPLLQVRLPLPAPDLGRRRAGAALPLRPLPEALPARGPAF